MLFVSGDWFDRIAIRAYKRAHTSRMAHTLGQYNIYDIIYEIATAVAAHFPIITLLQPLFLTHTRAFVIALIFVGKHTPSIAPGAHYTRTNTLYGLN